MKTIIFFFIIPILSLAQTNSIEEFEFKYFTQNIYDGFSFGQISNLKLFNDGTFTLKTSEETDEIKYPDISNGIYKVKKDTLTLISPLPKINIKQISESLIEKESFKFVVHLSNVYEIDFENKSNFYFIDENLKTQKVEPNEIKKNKINGEEIRIYSFIIPKESVYFSKKVTDDVPYVTLKIKDISGTEFSIYKEDLNTENKYIDCTGEKFLIRKNRQKLKSINKISLFGSRKKIRIVYLKK